MGADAGAVVPGWNITGDGNGIGPFRGDFVAPAADFGVPTIGAALVEHARILGETGDERAEVVGFGGLQVADNRVRTRFGPGTTSL
jgi:hypothetical protein